MTSVSSSSPPSGQREFMAHIWLGMDFFAWLRLLWRNRLAVSPSLIYVALIVTFVSIWHTLLGYLQDAWYGSRLDRTPVRQPLFIVGHWRTGTTLLHELLILDERHTCPTNYQCLVPHYFLLVDRVFKKLFWFLMPSRRPMDNMLLGWDRPQEDEFALCMLGAPSPYLTIAFPNHPPYDPRSFDIEGLPPADRKRWQSAFLRFLRRLSFKDPRRLVLKSPTHSCRLKVLMELFPDARFVHIVRDPYTVFASTVNLWKSLYEGHGMHHPTYQGLEEYVFSTFVHLYDQLEKGKQAVPPGHLHELSYEDLIRDPVGELRKLYDHLELGGFDEALPRMQKYLADNAGYQTNRYKPLDPALRDEITRRWGEVIWRYGYDRTSPQGKPAAEAAG
jgi:omega-hydroxy-beta-dihydromenaquinone-9 sulfotransferase